MRGFWSYGLRLCDGIFWMSTCYNQKRKRAEWKNYLDYIGLWGICLDLTEARRVTVKHTLSWARPWTVQKRKGRRAGTAMSRQPGHTCFSLLSTVGKIWLAALSSCLDFLSVIDCTLESEATQTLSSPVLHLVRVFYHSRNQTRTGC